MTATPTPGGLSERSVSLPVSLAGEKAPISRWWRLAGGVLMTSALGTLYAWSVFVTPLENEFGWKRVQTSSVFTLAVVMFAGSLLLGGRLQDRFGPFWISLTGSFLVSLSFLLFAFTSSLLSLYFFYGVLGGIGLGFGFGTVVPVMAKWFPDRTGLAIGLALVGFGGGSAVFGTFANLVLFPRFGWRTSCIILSAIFLAMTMTGAFLLRNPASNPSAAKDVSVEDAPMTRRHFAPGEVLRMPDFYLLWFGFGLGSTAGLMVISQLIPFANNQGVASATLATLGLVVGALGNSCGRVLSGWLSDLMGRLNTLRAVLLALERRDARDVLGGRASGGSLRADFYRVFLLWRASLGDPRDRGRFLGLALCGIELRIDFHGVGIFGDSWADHRRRPVRQVQKLWTGVLHRGGSFGGRPDLHDGGQAPELSVKARRTHIRRRPPKRAGLSKLWR